MVNKQYEKPIVEIIHYDLDEIMTIVPGDDSVNFDEGFEED